MNNSSHDSARGRRNRRSTHRRANSYNGPSATYSYGSMDTSATQSLFSPVGSGAPPLPRGRGSKTGAGDRNRSGSADFSPVSEIRKLTGSGGSGGGGIRPPASLKL